MKPTILIALLMLSKFTYAQNEIAFTAEASNKGYSNSTIEVEERSNEAIPSIAKRDTLVVTKLTVDTVRSTVVPDRTLTTKGIALWLDSPSKENTQNFYALHKYLPIGTFIKVINPMNERLIEVKVLGKLPDTQEYENISIMVSAATARQLNVLDEKFIVRMIIPVSAIHASAKK